MDKGHDGILGVMLEHKDSEYRFLVFCCYLSPENSVWGRDSMSFFSHLLSQIYFHSDTSDAIAICGDINARVGDLKDFIPSVDNIDNRVVIDNTVNQHGRSLIEFLHESKFCMLNGRVCKGNNGFTCTTARGNSVVDYCLVPHDILETCSNFNVISMVDLLELYDIKHLLGSHCRAPDYSMLCFDMSINVMCENISETVDSVHFGDSSLIFSFERQNPDFMNSDLCKQALCNIIDVILCNRERQNDIDSIYESFVNTVYTEMQVNVPHFDISKPMKKRWRPRKGFWNDNLENLWKEMHIKEKIMRGSVNRNDRINNHRIFKLAQNNFDKEYRKEERKFQQLQSNKFDTIQSTNPKLFWNELNKLGPKRKAKIPLEVYNNVNETVTDVYEVLEKWKVDFQSLYSIIDDEPIDEQLLNNTMSYISQRENDMVDPLWVDNEDLNSNFTTDEVKNIVMKCKNGKASGIDSIPYEALKNDQAISVLTHMFQLCFDCGKVPSMWLRSIINPIAKSKDNDPRIPLNYRGISLICCTSKIYSSLLNNRIIKYLNHTNKIADEQNGFRKGRSCSDHIFSLDTVLRSLVKDKPVFAAFVDFKKAFDCINKNFLFFKILRNNIEGKLYWAVKALYANNEACVKVNNYLTSWFQCKKGVRQGDTLSPTLFSIFINDLATDIKRLNMGVKFGDEDLSILLYADDVVLLSDNAEHLQSMLDTLHTWCTKWKVFINKENSNIVHFRKVNSRQSTHNFKVGPLIIDYASQYEYLGIIFTEYLSFDKNAEALADSGRRALGALVSKLKKNNFMGYQTYTKLYNSCVIPVLDYGSEIWGFKQYSYQDVVQNKALRIYLGVHRFAPVAGLEGDMAWFSPSHRRWINMLRYWNKLISMENSRLTKRIFEWAHGLASGGTTNWCKDVFNILSAINKITVFENKQQVNIDECKLLLSQIQANKWFNILHLKPKLRFYVKFKNVFEVEKYAKINLSHSERSVLAQIRFGILPLHVETGRFTNTAIDERTCRVCDSNNVEDEMHFMFECNSYEIPRNAFFENVLYHCPDFYYLEENDQLKFIFCEVPRLTAKFIKACLEIRKNILYH